MAIVNSKPEIIAMIWPTCSKSDLMKFWGSNGPCQDGEVFLLVEFLKFGMGFCEDRNFPCQQLSYVHLGGIFSYIKIGHPPTWDSWTNQTCWVSCWWTAGFVVMPCLEAGNDSSTAHVIMFQEFPTFLEGWCLWEIRPKTKKKWRGIVQMIFPFQMGDFQVQAASFFCGGVLHVLFSRSSHWSIPVIENNGFLFFHFLQFRKTSRNTPVELIDPQCWWL